MKIAVFGAGYVGLVTAVCLAHVGNQVVCVDVNEARITQLMNGVSPLHEAGLQLLLQQTLETNHIQFTTDSDAAIQQSDIIFIAVGTPSCSDGSANLNQLFHVGDTIAHGMQKNKIIVIKSTVPVGTADQIGEIIAGTLKNRCMEHLHFDIVSNPEFLKEGVAVQDFMKPDRIIIGANSIGAIDKMKQLYSPFNRNRDRLIIMDRRSAELTKYVANAMLATKISFMNEMSRIAEVVGADIEQVRIGIGADPRIGYAFIYPGCGYGGSCLPKDVRALKYSARAKDINAPILQAVHDTNQQQQQLLFQKLLNRYEDNLSNKCIAIWGLAFKPNTDDIRYAPAIALIEKLLIHCARIQVYDPQAMINMQQYFSRENNIQYCHSQEEALINAHALVIVTEWPCFRNPDFEMMQRTLIDRVVIDGRNLFEPRLLETYQLEYHSIGRKSVVIKYSNV